MSETLADRARLYLPAEDILALTLWGEARSEPVEGIIAVGNVIANRLKGSNGDYQFGRTWQEVLLRKWQFSCWIPEGGERNYQRLSEIVNLWIASRIKARETLEADARLRQCVWIAQGFVSDQVRDNTYGANHYHVTNMEPLPKWADPSRVTVKIGAHTFYKL